ncbi:MAG: TAT-variant-translocated molybdopterin oxidoreductase [Planctomycetes bacterium]|nr:TAT-variant-translocated molybdopterin oxidoreductase [Planctomycetota bacterium]
MNASSQPDRAADPVTYWRSVEQLERANAADGAEFEAAVAREFPEGITEAPDAVSRRGFLSVVAASAALAGLTSCRKPVTKIVPFTKRPDGFKPGLAQTYATTLTRGGYAIGVVAKSSDGRPTKLEINPKHPSQFSGSDLQLQAELLQLYDPARSRRARHGAAAATGAAHAEGHGAEAGEATDVWGDFAAHWDEVAKDLLNIKRGEGLHVLMAPTTSPSLLNAIKKMKEGAAAKARFYTWSALHDDNALAGAQMAFGKALAARPDYSKADVVLSLDCDFLATEGNNLVSAGQWGSRRRKAENVSRLYMVEATYSSTGTAADHRFRTKSSEVPAVAFALAKALGVGNGSELERALGNHNPAAFEKGGKKWVEIIARDLKAAAGRCLVVAGRRQPPAVHAIAHAINDALGNIGKTVTFTALPEGVGASSVASIQELAAALQNGAVDTLVCLGTNPVYDAPADLGFADLIGKAKQSIHVGTYDDETGRRSEWHFPLAHELETWGDARAHDGTVSMQQPLIAPLHGGVSALEFLALLNQDSGSELLTTSRDTTVGYEVVKAYWQTASGATDFPSWWQHRLHDGFVADSQFATENVTTNTGAIAAGVAGFSKASGGIEVNFRGCPKMADGRFANNSWMAEIPDPVSKLSWDNAALLSIATARQLGVENGDRVNIAANGAQLQIPAWILPGHADDSITIHLGWGRHPHDDCKVARDAGFDAYPLRTAAAQWLLTGAQVSRGQGHYDLVTTQEQGTMVGRAIVREATVAKNLSDPDWATKMSPLDKAARLHGENLREKDLNKSLWTERYDPRRNDPEVKKSPYQWGMVIDLNACTGCSACMVACVAENNVAMVGKIQVKRNREMFWIRTDRYFSSRVDDLQNAAEDPQVSNMPVPCMQCENAPCESVCPVAATTHSPDGLNDMVYNRCIGTRYCSNNCPYKVRRYNYLDYVSKTPATKQMAFNPDVTVRSRGVMEKCTFCVQRINGGRIEAKLHGKKVGDGDHDVRVTTACAQACPTQAITFGNIIEPTSAVAKLKENKLNYGLLSELNTKPRTTYLGRVRNPNPELQNEPA